MALFGSTADAQKIMMPVFVETTPVKSIDTEASESMKAKDAAGYIGFDVWSVDAKMNDPDHGFSSNTIAAECRPTTAKVATVVQQAQQVDGKDWFSVSHEDDRTLKGENPELEVPTSASDIPKPATSLGSNGLEFYWFDATELNGVVFVFGKIEVEGGRFESCCIRVEDMDRNLFILPREDATDGRHTSIDLNKHFLLSTMPCRIGL